MPSVSSHLCTQINECWQVSASGQYFLDPQHLRSILPHHVIIKAMHESSFPQHQHLLFAEQISHTGLTTFAILLHLRRSHEITKFLERNELDARLPMTKDQLSDIIPQDAAAFFKDQWGFIPYIFQRNPHQHIHNDNFVLPFLKDRTLDDLEGGFGAMSEVTIAPSMQAMVPDQVRWSVAARHILFARVFTAM